MQPGAQAPGRPRENHRVPAGTTETGGISRLRLYGTSSSAPSGLVHFLSTTHGLRRGLDSCAASRLTMRESTMMKTALAEISRNWDNVSMANGERGK